MSFDALVKSLPDDTPIVLEYAEAMGELDLFLQASSEAISLGTVTHAGAACGSGLASKR